MKISQIFKLIFGASTTVFMFRNWNNYEINYGTLDQFNSTLNEKLNTIKNQSIYSTTITRVPKKFQNSVICLKDLYSSFSKTTQSPLYKKKIQNPIIEEVDYFEKTTNNNYQIVEEP